MTNTLTIVGNLARDPEVKATRTADQAATLHKGDRVLATGKLQANSWEDKNGNKRTDIQLIADTLAVIPKTTNQQQPQNNGWTQNTNGAWGNTNNNAWNTNTGDEAPPF